ncbi:MAG: DUF4465 domain-containing protein [Myxococcota bacterium]
MSSVARLPSLIHPSRGVVLAIRAVPLASGPTRHAARAGFILLALVGLFAASASALTADFEDLGLAPETFLDPFASGGGFASGGIRFENDGAFLGFSASTTTDTTTPGFTNQYSTVTGAGAGGSSTFGVAYADARIVLPFETIVAGASFTNTTYAALSMRNGDAFSKRFGGASGSDPDYLRLLVEGFDDLGASTGRVELMLADYRFADDSLDFILDEWVFLDLSGLGAVKSLVLAWESSDVGPFGINTPTYVALDDLTTIPEPGAALLLGLGLIGLGSLGLGARGSPAASEGVRQSPPRAVAPGRPACVGTSRG